MQKLNDKRKREKIEKILNHSVTGEGYILTAPRIWKEIVLRNFNRVQRNELSIGEVIDLLESEGVRFNQSKALIFYPVNECLQYIATVANISLEGKEGNKIS